MSKEIPTIKNDIVVFLIKVGSVEYGYYLTPNVAKAVAGGALLNIEFQQSDTVNKLVATLPEKPDHEATPKPDRVNCTYAPQDHPVGYVCNKATCIAKELDNAGTKQ